MAPSADDADVFRRQRWTGWVAALAGGPLGLALVGGGLADGQPVIVVFGLGLLVLAGLGLRRGTDRTPALVLDEGGLTHGASGVRLAWDEVTAVRPATRWHRGQFRVRTLELDVRDPADVAQRVSNRAGRAVLRLAGGSARGPVQLLLNDVAADANEVLEAVERRWGSAVAGRFTFFGVDRAGDVRR